MDEQHPDHLDRPHGNGASPPLPLLWYQNKILEQKPETMKVVQELKFNVYQMMGLWIRIQEIETI